MENIPQYIMQIVSAALLCSVVTQVVGEKNPSATVVKMITGTFMFLCLVNPLANLRLQDLTKYFDSLSLQTDQSVNEGQLAAFEEMSAIIKSKTEAGRELVSRRIL